ncbi:conserved hypothetical protein [Theileria orientalis strain Shintoku]|uniref:Uncharacterized protein n=1 Tax=Theileria orientalis strain Shintoku TaxID=869250 RepID=J4C348_THEOR|nr:conserved hypothetical protein [Theileria orientalis strain Shintoku]BAM39816.1 conserved hypothetical protein [Theileria orientalis strain Shintoku]|eukprot:XP_009690117.1 conserved hypothetical protein [Theileria orientalis strain Shintoku]
MLHVYAYFLQLILDSQLLKNKVKRRKRTCKKGQKQYYWWKQKVSRPKIIKQKWQFTGTKAEKKKKKKNDQ